MKYNGRAAAGLDCSAGVRSQSEEASRATSGTWLDEDSPGARVARDTARLMFS